MTKRPRPTCPRTVFLSQFTQLIDSDFLISVASTLQAGCFAACFVTPWLTDRYGRRWALIGTGLITIVGVVLQTGSAGTGNIGAMYAGRFVAGLGVGAASMLTPLYVSECAPRAIRGGLTGRLKLDLLQLKRD